MPQVVITNQSQPSVIPVHADICANFWRRLKGLMFHSPLSYEEGLLLIYSRDSRSDTTIHMMFVATDLTVVWINRDNIVVDVCLAKRWGLAYSPQMPARFVLEMAPERMQDFKIGDIVQMNSSNL